MSQYVTVQEYWAKRQRSRMWFRPANCPEVGRLRRNGRTKTIYDTGERMPGGIPVLAVRKGK